MNTQNVVLTKGLMKMPQLDRTGAQLNYEVWGDGPVWLTLINGHTRPLTDFRLMGRKLTSHGLKILALDNRGAGETIAADGFTLEDMVDDIVALWDHEGIEQSHVLGISMGGFIAQWLAAEYAERVGNLVLVSTAAGPAHIKSDDEPWSTDPDQVGQKLAPYFTGKFRVQNKLLVDAMVKQIVKAVREGDFAERGQAQRAAIQGYNGTQRLSEIKAPTLVVHGQDDGIIPFAAAEELASGIAQAKLHSFADAGHLLLAERPQPLFSAVRDFLTSK